MPYRAKEAEFGTPALTQFYNFFDCEAFCCLARKGFSRVSLVPRAAKPPGTKRLGDEWAVGNLSSKTG